MVPVETSRFERTLLAIALVFIIIIAVKMTSYIISLVLMSLIITLLTVPALVWLKKKGLSGTLSVAVITLAACLVIAAILYISVFSFQLLLHDMPQFQQEFSVRLAELRTILSTFGISIETDSIRSIDLKEIFSAGVAGVTTIAEGLMFLFFVAVTSFFMLLEAPRLTERFEARYGKDSQTVKQFGRMSGYIIDFIVVRTETNFIHGILFGGFLTVMGVHGALLWGLLTFLLGYIPYIGLIMAAVPAIFFAWLQFGIPGAVAVIVVVCILNLIVENPIFSYLTSRKYEIPALIVILSVIFWGWLLGIVGMLFAIPCTLICLLVLQLSDDLRWINDFLGVGHLFEEHTRKKDD
ncbi:AI-2E family transporter [Methanoregula formicica]|uniref:Putative permease n=1 Tax=Methanoregula formicica (strain DSM 22288 / NBRC 105244 / SMSP) TaxID=593750 RepID=L0HER3_METFS|nr:AI-2E family transporter [Methanoregula formicica]AGB03202.1 putative permease [Methanoregula formicica SMSP]